MKLMYDNTDISFEQELSEGVEKKYRIKGIFSTPEKTNKNGRVYPRTVWEREVAKYQDVLNSGHPNCLMELDHPPRSNVDMMEAVAKMEKLYFENGYVMGEAVLLDNPKANQLKTLIDNGIKMSVSSRGVGSVKGNIVENYNLITFDIIPNLGQSNYESEMYGIVEGVLQDKNFLITESGEIIETAKPQDPIQEELKESKELSIEEKKILAQEFVNKFSKVLTDVQEIQEAMKVNSKIAAIQAIQMSISKISDEKIKGLLQASVDFLMKEFKINEAVMIKNKFKIGKVVTFLDGQGKKQKGSVAKFGYDKQENGNYTYFYDIETTQKLFKDIPEGDINK